MMKFITRFFAVIGFVLVLLITLGTTWFVHEKEETPNEPDSVILTLDFDQPIAEQNESSPLSLALHDEEPTALLDILHAIDQAKSDQHVKGIYAHFGTTQPSLAQAQEIRDALLRFRSSGKFMYAFGASYGEFGLGNRAYYLASAFDNIWLQPVGSVGLSGLAIQSPFAKAALDKIGVTADFMRREEYKSVMEMATRDSFSDTVKQNTQDMLNDLFEQESKGIAEGRKWDQDRVKRLMEKGPYTTDEAVSTGLVTHIGYEEELDKEFDGKAGADAKQVDATTYLSYDDKSDSKEKAKKPTKIALIYGTGLIVSKAGGAGSEISGEHMMGADTIADAFDDAADDKDVKAILFRVDSPGGSPEASETIRAALLHAQKKGKPVIVSMGEVAASGGYWISMSSDWIVAEPGTITGSIGVVAGKFVAGPLMQKLGVSWQTLKTADDAGMWSMVDEFTPAQRERVNALLDETYKTFTTDVSVARKIPMEKISDIAKGRVWTGAQAAKIGLVDDLGGYDVALGAIRKKLNLGENDQLSLEQFPAQLSPAEKIMKLLKGVGVQSAMVGGVLSQWQGVQSTFGPYLSDLSAYNHPVSARLPASVLRVVR